MTATAPRKKAAPRRTAEQRRVDNVTRFDEYKERARKIQASGAAPRKVEPYVISAAELEDGIDADVILVPPTSLTSRTALDRAIRTNDMVSIIVILGGEVSLNRITHAFDREAERSGDDPDLLFAALGYSIINHINGAGAAEVPGGSDAS